jgi:hypothetical protein
MDLNDLQQGATTVGKTLLTIMSAAAGVPQGQEKKRQEEFRVRAAMKDPVLLTLPEFAASYDKAAGFKGAHNFELMHHAEQQRQQQAILRAAGVIPESTFQPPAGTAASATPAAPSKPLPPGVSYSTKYGGGELSVTGQRTAPPGGSTGVSKIWSDIDAEMAKDKPNMAKVKDLHDRLKVLTADPIATAAALTGAREGAKQPFKEEAAAEKAATKVEEELDNPLPAAQVKDLEMVDAEGNTVGVDLKSIPRRELQKYAEKLDATGQPIYHVRAKRGMLGALTGQAESEQLPLSSILPKRTPPLRSSAPGAPPPQRPMSGHTQADLTPNEQLERALIQKYKGTATGG